MDSKQLKLMLSTENIASLLTQLGADPKPYHDMLLCRTICHCGNKHKLYYYPDHHSFVCYTGGCGSMDVFTLVQKTRRCSFFESLVFIQSFFGIKGNNQPIDIIENPMDYIHKQLKTHKPQILKPIDENIVNTYYSLIYPGWVEEGISLSTIRKYNIKFSIVNQAIIIPHYNSSGQLLGIRGRNIDPIAVAQGYKYTPVKYKGKFLKYPTGENLYGLHLTKNAIKNTRQIILFEAEKSVLKMDTALGNENNSVALNGSNITPTQIEMIKELGVDEVVVALDKEFKSPFTREERIYAEKIQSQFERLPTRFKTSVVWDVDNSLNYKDSPIDGGFQVFSHLMKERIFL